MDNINRNVSEGLLVRPPPMYTSGKKSLSHSNLDDNVVKVKEVLPVAPISRPSSVYTLTGNPPVGPVPLKVTCPHCGGYQLTTVIWRVTLRTHFAALICCVIGCWCLVPVPYLVKELKHAYHYCKICEQFIESYPAQ